MRSDRGEPRKRSSPAADSVLRFLTKPHASHLRDVLSGWPSVTMWAPFWRGTLYPVAGIAFLVVCADAFLFQALPSSARAATGFGLVLCVLESMRGFFTAGTTPCKKVVSEEGAGVLGAAGASHIDVRWSCAGMRGWRPTMEDSHISTVLDCGTQQFGLFGVFDGHGGWQVSHIAPTLIVDLLTKRLRTAAGGADPDLSVLLEETVKAMDDALLGGPFGLGRLMPLHSLHPFSRTGSTSCITAVDYARRQIVVANTGDSRAVVSRRGRAIALSEDHKPEDSEEFDRILKAGGRVVWSGPCWRIDGGLNLSRALGDFVYKANPALPMCEQKVVATPTMLVHNWDLEQDEFLIVACDGIFERLSRQDVVDHVRKGLADGREPGYVLQELLHRCCATSPGLGMDNETAVLVQWSAPHAWQEASA